MQWMALSSLRDRFLFYVEYNHFYIQSYILLWYILQVRYYNMKMLSF